MDETTDPNAPAQPGAVNILTPTETGDTRKPAAVSELMREADKMLQDAERIGHPDLVARALRNRNSAHRRAMKALAVQGNHHDVHAEQGKARLQQARAAKAATQRAVYNVSGGERGRQPLNKPAVAGTSEADAEDPSALAADESSAASALMRHAIVTVTATAANDAGPGATWAVTAAHGDKVAANLPGANPLLPSLGGRAKRLTKKQIAQERTKLRNQKRNEQQKVKLAKEQREATHRMAWQARRKGLMLVRVTIALPVRDDRAGFSIWPYGRTARVRFAYFSAKWDPATKKSVPNVLRQVTVAEVPLSEQLQEGEHYERVRAAKSLFLKKGADGTQSTESGTLFGARSLMGFNEVAKAPRDKAVQCARPLLSHQIVSFINAREQTVDEAAEALRDEHLGLLIAAIMKQHTRLFELAKKWDENKNGMIDNGEFVRAARSLGIGEGASNEEKQVDLEDVFDLLDEDKSGSIDYRELKSLLHAAMRKKAAARRHRDQQAAKRRQDTEQYAAAAAERSKSPSPHQGRQRRPSIVCASPASTRPPPDSGSTTASAMYPGAETGFRMGAGSGSATLSPWLTMNSKSVEDSHCHVGCQASLPFAMHAPALLHSLTYVAAREAAESARQQRTAVITPLNQYRMKAASRGALIAARSLSHKSTQLPQPTKLQFHPGNLSMRACAQHLSDILTSRGIQCPSVVTASTKQDLMLIARRHGISLQFTGAHHRRSCSVELEETARGASPEQLCLNLSLVDPRPEYGGEYGASCSGMCALPELGATSEAAAAATRARLTQAEFKLHTFDWTSFAGRASSRRNERIRQRKRMTAEVDAQRKRELASAAKRLQRALRRKLASRTPEQKAAAVRRQIERTAARAIQEGCRVFLRRKYGPDFGDIVLAHFLAHKKVRDTVTDLLNLIIERAVVQTRAVARERKSVQKRANERVLADRLCSHKTPRVAWPPPSPGTLPADYSASRRGGLYGRAVGSAKSSTRSSGRLRGRAVTVTG